MVPPLYFQDVALCHRTIKITTIGLAYSMPHSVGQGLYLWAVQVCGYIAPSVWWKKTTLWISSVKCLAWAHRGAEKMASGFTLLSLGLSVRSEKIRFSKVEHKIQHSISGPLLRPQKQDNARGSTDCGLFPFNEWMNLSYYSSCLAT